MFRQQQGHKCGLFAVTDTEDAARLAANSLLCHLDNRCVNESFYNIWRRPQLALTHCVDLDIVDESRMLEQYRQRQRGDYCKFLALFRGKQQTVYCFQLKPTSSLGENLIRFKNSFKQYQNNSQAKPWWPPHKSHLKYNGSNGFTP